MQQCSAAKVKTKPALDGVEAQWAEVPVFVFHTDEICGRSLSRDDDSAPENHVTKGHMSVKSNLRNRPTLHRFVLTFMMFVFRV